MSGIEVENHPQQNHVGEDDVVFHRVGVCSYGFAVFVFGKDKRLVGIAEGLRKHHHHHCHFEAGTIDTQLRLCIGSVVEEGEEDTIECLIHDTAYAQDQ